MNEELQKELAAWLAQLRDAANAGGNFVVEQAPLIVQEKILLGRVQWTVLAIVLLMIAIASAVVVAKHVRGVKARSGEHFDSLDLEPMVVVFFPMIGIGATVAGLHATSQAMTAWFAPRLYVLEWLASLI